MESRVEEVGPCRRRLTVTVPADEISSAIDKSYNDLRKTVALPGFRKGKTPRKVLEKRFSSHVIEDVKRDLIIDGIQDGIKSHELEVVSDPDIDAEGGLELPTEGDFEFSFHVDVRPEFELPELDGIKVERINHEVTDENIDSVLDRLRNENASWVPVEDEGAKEEDLVIGAMKFMDGEEEVFQREQAHVHVGTDEKIAGANLSEGTKPFVGAESEKTIETPITVPEDHPVPDLRGRDLSLRFEVQEVKRMELPEVDDELAEHYHMENLEALKTKIREDLEAGNKDRAENEVEEKIIDAMLERVEIPLPETTVEKTIDSQAQEQLMQRIYSGQMPTDDIQGAMQALREELRPDAERSIRAWYVMQKFAKREKIFATEADVQERIEKIAIARGTTPTKIREELAEKDAFDQVRNAVLEEKVRSWLCEQVEITDATGPAEDAGAEA